MAALTFVYDNSEELTEELYIPDPNFKAYLLTEVDMDGDGILTKADAKAWNESALSKSFYLAGKSIKSLEGIRYFTALTYLNCVENQLTSLDVSECTALETLYCGSNLLTNLVVGKNTVLTDFECKSNQLTTLDVSGCPALETLNCAFNQLTTLDLSKTNIGNSAESYPLHCGSMFTLTTLYLKTGWRIRGINIGRTTGYIPDQTEILYK